jgi:hypothetical protein
VRLFGMLKGIRKDREFNLNDEIEEVIASAWNGLSFDDVQRVFRNWTSSLALIVKSTLESIRNKSSCSVNVEIGRGGTVFTPRTSRYILSGKSIFRVRSMLVELTKTHSIPWREAG